ncbi:hypothetical protein LGH70_12410 [Hymenobacter sp. BT635]|uniref:DUF4034 domain-containing protein n=1 Tax=Hymenobacter nitidus TaxID=2880929 RepID=A0ABS8ADA4_9BACT|nr:hypothetical protein [Hymenobacter nitidus]MCB2378393.1 hypothetical protein [Hymenobacter nitidus]
MLSFFSSLFSAKPEERDLSFGLKAEYGIDALVRRQQWAAVEATAQALPGDALSRLLDGICLSHQHHEEVTRYAVAAASEFGHLLAGAWYLFLAWEARTGKWGNQLTTAEVDGFGHYLSLAEQSLNRPFANPAFGSEAQARLVRVWMGFSEKDKALDSFTHSTALDETKFWAYHHLFKVLSAKWLGSKDELRAFVDAVELPAMRYALLAMYLVEVFDDFDTEDARSAQRKWYAENRAGVAQLLALPALPVNSSLVSVYANNNLAYLWHLLGEREKRDRLLDQLGNRVPVYPWAYFGLDSPKAMRAFRKGGALARP